MTIRERKRMLFFLEMLKEYVEKHDANKMSSDLFKLFNRTELIELIKWLNEDSLVAKNDLEIMETHELIDAIGTDLNLLSFAIQKWKAHLTSRPTMSQDEVHSFFRERMGLSVHYLSDKPVGEWDEYDSSNYYLKGTPFFRQLFYVIIN